MSSNAVPHRKREQPVRVPFSGEGLFWHSAAVPLVLVVKLLNGGISLLVKGLRDCRMLLNYMALEGLNPQERQLLEYLWLLCSQGTNLTRIEIQVRRCRAAGIQEWRIRSIRLSSR